MSVISSYLNNLFLFSKPVMDDFSETLKLFQSLLLFYALNLTLIDKDKYIHKIEKSNGRVTYEQLLKAPVLITFQGFHFYLKLFF